MSASLPHRWRFDFNWTAGMTLERWAELLVRERFAVDREYLHRAAFVTAVATANTAMAAASSARYRRRERAITRIAPPLFVVGHWRQGTTHLHNLLSLDPQFTFPSTYEVTNPRHFLLTERALPRLLGPMLPKTRPQDAMALGFALPQEDEYATALDSLVSPHFAMVFPRSADRYLAHLSFKGARRADVERWKRTMRRFARRHAVRDPRPLVLKSPAHTARVRTLLELFPDARFVHIHRDPYEVFASTRHLLDTAGWFQHLQVPDTSVRDERVLATYEALYTAWFADRPRIPDGQVVDLAFADLERDPLGTLRATYEALGLPGFDAARPRMSAYLDGLRGYTRNALRPLSPAERAAVSERWGPHFTHWGYPR